MSSDWGISDSSRREIPNGHVIDREIARVAARQKQLIRLDQLRAYGLTDRGVEHRVTRGSLFRLYRGVFAAHAPPYSQRQKWLAAVLACGPGAALSDLPAAALLFLTENVPPITHVTTTNDAGRALGGIVAHRRRLDPQDIWRVDGIPCTSAARTIIDCAHVLGLEGTEQLIMAADSSGRLNRRRLEELVAEHRGRPGIGHVRALIIDDPPELRNENERRMFAICREFGIVRPLTNHPIRVGDRLFIADFCWPDLQLIVKADSWRWHGGRLASERDADRDQLLAIAGWRVVHFTRDQIKRRREETGRRLVALTVELRAPGA